MIPTSQPGPIIVAADWPSPVDPSERRSSGPLGRSSHWLAVARGSSIYGSGPEVSVEAGPSALGPFARDRPRSEIFPFEIEPAPPPSDRDAAETGPIKATATSEKSTRSEPQRNLAARRWFEQGSQVREGRGAPAPVRQSPPAESRTDPPHGLIEQAVAIVIAQGQFEEQDSRRTSGVETSAPRVESSGRRPIPGRAVRRIADTCGGSSPVQDRRALEDHSPGRDGTRVGESRGSVGSASGCSRSSRGSSTCSAPGEPNGIVAERIRMEEEAARARRKARSLLMPVSPRSSLSDSMIQSPQRRAARPVVPKITLSTGLYRPPGTQTMAR